jgi:hypothetical protein
MKGLFQYMSNYCIILVNTYPAGFGNKGLAN